MKRRSIIILMAAMLLTLMLPAAVFAGDGTTYNVQVINGKAEPNEAEQGQTVKITANTPDTGKFFLYWTADRNAVHFAKSDGIQTTFVMINNPVNITANYGKILIYDVADQVYTGEPLEPKPDKVELEGVDAKLFEGTDYTLTYRNNVDAGTATVIVTLKGPWVGSAEKTFSIRPADLSTATVTFEDQVYNGKAHEPVPTVTWNGMTLETSDYAVSFSNNVHVGTAKAVLTGRNNFLETTGTEGKFNIKRRPAAIKAADASKVQGKADPAFTGTVEGLAGENDLGKITFSRTGNDEEPGVYKGVITSSYTDNPDYDVTVTNGDFTIQKAKDPDDPVDPDDPDDKKHHKGSPGTGDENDAAGLIALMAASATGLAAIGYRRRRDTY